MPASQSSIDALLYPMNSIISVWNTSTAPAYNFTYQFAGASQPGDLWAGFSGWTAFTDPAKRAALVSVLDEYEEIINVTFTEVTGQADPDINFGLVSLNGGQGGFNYSYSTSNGQVVSRTYDAFAVFGSTIDLTTPDGRNLLLHEIGHALSLKHPGAYDVGGNIPPPPYLPTAEDNNKYSVMSYNVNPDNGLDSDHLMLYDIAALQARWGANLSTRTGNDTYTAPAGRMQVIWAAGGTDTIAASAQSPTVRIDLRPSHYSAIGRTTDNLAVAFDVSVGGSVVNYIENATGGSANDTIYGNEIANVLRGQSGNDRMNGFGGADNLNGGAGNDTLFGSLGYDKVYGGTGIDSLYGDGGNDTLYGGGGNDRMNGGVGRDTFVFNTALNASTNRDTILDFSHVDDTIRLTHDVFSAVSTGALTADAFYVVGSGAPRDAEDRIFYNPTTGVLSYDADGNAAGGVAAIQFAVLRGAPADLSFDDFIVV